MADGMKSIIAQLELQLKAIERALSALHDVGDIGMEGSAPIKEARLAAPASRKGRMTPAGRKRLAAAMKKRWAVKRAESSVATRKSGRKKSVAKAA